MGIMRFISLFSGIGGMDLGLERVGVGVPEHVILVGESPVTLHVNGAVSTVAPEAHVTEVTRPLRPRNAV